MYHDAGAISTGLNPDLPIAILGLIAVPRFTAIRRHGAPSPSLTSTLLPNKPHLIAWSSQWFRWVAKEARPISLRQLMVFGRTLTESRLIRSANYVRTELPTRYDKMPSFPRKQTCQCLDANSFLLLDSHIVSATCRSYHMLSSQIPISAKFTTYTIMPLIPSAGYARSRRSRTTIGCARQSAPCFEPI